MVLDSYLQKNEIQPPTYTIQKSKFKVDKMLKNKLQHHKSPRGEHSQESLILIYFKLYFIDYTIRVVLIFTHLLPSTQHCPSIAPSGNPPSLFHVHGLGM